MADEMKLELRAPGRSQRLNRVEQQVAAAPRCIRELGVFFHLAPHRSRQRPADGLLDQQIGLVGEPLAGASDRRLTAERVGDDVADRFEQTGLPDQKDRIAAVADKEAAHRARALDRIGFAVESAMRIDHEALGRVGL